LAAGNRPNSTIIWI